MKNIPQKLFLVIPDDEPKPKDFNELDHEFVCWCADRIGKYDLEYRLVKKAKRKKTTPTNQTKD